MAKVRIIENTLVKGVHADAGEVLEVDSRTGTALMVAGKAVPCADEPEKPTVREPLTREKTKKKRK